MGGVAGQVDRGVCVCVCVCVVVGWGAVWEYPNPQSWECKKNVPSSKWLNNNVHLIALSFACD